MSPNQAVGSLVMSFFILRTAHIVRERGGQQDGSQIVVGTGGSQSQGEQSVKHLLSKRGNPLGVREVGIKKGRPQLKAGGRRNLNLLALRQFRPPGIPQRTQIGRAS